MFHRKTFGNQKQKIQPKPFPYFFIETLEDRQLLSASVTHHALHSHHKTASSATHASKKHAKSSSTTATASALASAVSADPTTFSGFGKQIDSIAFDLTPTLVQNGLNALASTDGIECADFYATRSPRQLQWRGNLLARLLDYRYAEPAHR